MASSRFGCAVLVALACSVAIAQQPPRDSRPGRPATARLFAEAESYYKAGQWLQAVEAYEAALAEDPRNAAAYLLLGNSYDNLYKPSRAGETANDSYLQKAVHNYTIASERGDARTRRLALEYLIAAYTEKLNDPSRAEPFVRQVIAMDPSDPAGYFTLAKLYEDAGYYEAAEQALDTARDLNPRNAGVYRAIAGFHNRLGDFPRTIAALEQAAALEPDRPEAHQLLATHYWEKAQKDHRLSRADKLTLLLSGLAATDRALALDPDYLEALTYKNILRRMQAREEKDPSLQAQLIAEADALRERAIQLSKAQAAATKR